MILKVALSGSPVVVFTDTKHRVQSPLERWPSRISMNRPKMESRPCEFLLHLDLQSLGTKANCSETYRNFLKKPWDLKLDASMLFSKTQT